jgi:hypothetical protein
MTMGIALLLVLGGCSRDPDESASGPKRLRLACASALTDVSPATGRSGDLVVVMAVGMMDSCLTVQSTHTPEPLRNQPVVWRQGGRELTLGYADADADGTIRMAVEVPRTAVPGTATLTVGRSAPVSFAVTGG